MSISKKALYGALIFIQHASGFSPDLRKSIQVWAYDEKFQWDPYDAIYSPKSSNLVLFDQ